MREMIIIYAQDIVNDPNSIHSILRPETVESLFILHRVTGNSTYREWGWEIFQAIERSARTDVGYSGVYDVGDARPRHNGIMPRYPYLCLFGP